MSEDITLICRNSLKESIEIDEFLELEQMALEQEKLDDFDTYKQHCATNAVEKVEMESNLGLFIPAPPPLDFSSDEEHDDLTIPEEDFPRYFTERIFKILVFVLGARIDYQQLLKRMKVCLKFLMMSSRRLRELPRLSIS